MKTHMWFATNWIRQMVEVIRRHALFILLCLVFLTVGIMLSLSWYQYQLNPDAASYFTIAYKYAHGDVSHALNGYWGPLLSWLLVPAVWLHANMISAAKIIAVLGSLGILVTLYAYLSIRNVSRFILLLISLALGSMLLQWSTVGPVTPDVLIALATLLFGLTLNTFLSRPTLKMGLIVGALGACMFFAKGFGFFLFIGVIGSIGLWQWWYKDERKWKITLKRYLPMLAMFTLLVAPFIIAISCKYHTPTINNAGAYDHVTYGPAGLGLGAMTHMGPLAPPNSSAMSIWEDPTQLTRLFPRWSPLDSGKDFTFFWQRVIGHNLAEASSSWMAFGPVGLLGLFGLLCGALEQKKERKQEYVLFAYLLGIMIAGYSLVLLEGRYLWGGLFLTVAGGALWLSRLQQRKLLGTWQIFVCGAIAVAITMTAAIQNIVRYQYLDKYHYTTSLALESVIPAGSKVISDDFSDSFFACWHIHLNCYSILDPPVVDDHPYYETLKRMGVIYYIDFHTRDSNTDLQKFVDTYYTQVDERITDSGPVTTYLLRTNL